MVDYWILGLKAPTNIEKKVTELRTSLYRDWELASALARISGVIRSIARSVIA